MEVCTGRGKKVMEVTCLRVKMGRKDILLMRKQPDRA